MADDKVRTDDQGEVWEAVMRPRPTAPFALRVHKGDQCLRTVRLEPDITYIGRMSENHVVLDDPKVSRSHARVMNRNGEYFIEDQESEHGIYVRGVKVTEHLLSPGEKVAVGGHVLEVIRASEEHRTSQRESRLEVAEEEEWRLDQTISGSPEQLRKMLAERAAKSASSKNVKAPTLSFELRLGSKVFQKSVDFTQARARKEGDLTGDAVEVRVSAGKWVLYKKIPL
ncbi:MAG: FHA domain-containing protein [Pseudomonadota bacterium]